MAHQVNGICHSRRLCTTTSESVASEATEEAPEAPAQPATPQPAIPKKTLVYAGIVLAVLWAFAIHTESLVVEIIVGVLTALAVGLLLYAWRLIRKQRGYMQMLQGANASPEARREALAKLEAEKDPSAPTNLFARAQLVAQDDPKAALAILDQKDLKSYPAAMQDDVATLKAQLYLVMGRTQDARKAADTINLDNPARKEMRTLSGAIVAEAFARTGKPKEALAILESLEPPKKDAEQLEIQMRVVRVFAKFAMNQRQGARAELVALADDDVNHLGRFLAPQFRVHPELQKLARQVAEANPGARAAAKTQAKTQAKRR